MLIWSHECGFLSIAGVYIINLRKTWEKLLLAARAIAAIENPADISVISARPYGQRAVLKFASATGATAIAGRFTPGTFTNQIQVKENEVRYMLYYPPLKAKGDMVMVSVQSVRHNSKIIQGNFLKPHTVLTDIERKCSVQEP